MLGVSHYALFMAIPTSPAALTLTLTRGTVAVVISDRYDWTGSMLRVRSLGSKRALVQTGCPLTGWNEKAMSWRIDFADSERYALISEEQALDYATRRQAMYEAHGCPNASAFDNSAFRAYHVDHKALLAEVVGADALVARDARLAREEAARASAARHYGWTA